VRNSDNALTNGLNRAYVSLEWLNRGLQIVNLAERFVDLTVSKRPFETLDLVTYGLAPLCLVLHQTFAVLAQYRQFHGQMKPIQ
jgi:hypothetical protein